MDRIYPFDVAPDPHLPTTRKFAVLAVTGTIGKGIQTLVAFDRGDLVSRFTGQLSNHIMQHTLQVSPDTHLNDPYFVGLLTHSCAPNCLLDMARLEIRALVDITPGDVLTIDYAVTEDKLHRQFPCHCGASNCRHWITGRREKVNQQGQAFLSQRFAVCET